MLYLKNINLEFFIKLKNSKKIKEDILQPINTSSTPLYHVFNEYLWITQDFCEDDLLVKKIHDTWHIINIVIKNMTEKQYSEEELAIIEFRNLIGDHEIVVNYETEIIDIIPIIQKSCVVYFHWENLNINVLGLLGALYKSVSIHYSDIDHCFHIYVSEYCGDIYDYFKLNDYITNFDKTNVIILGYNKLLKKVKQWFLEIKMKYDDIKKRGIALNKIKKSQKEFSIQVAKYIKNGMIKAYSFAKKNELELSKHFIEFNEKNCMIYRLNRFFTYDYKCDMNKLLITEEGLYSISKPNEASIITKYILDDLIGLNCIPETIIDMTANVGGNVINFCKSFSKIFAIEYDWMNYLILRNNIDAYDYSEKVLITNDTCLSYLDMESDVMFFDPPWGGISYKDHTNVDLYLDGISIIEIIKSVISEGNVKLISVKVPFNFNFKNLNFLDKKMYNIYRIKNICLINIFV